MSTTTKRTERMIQALEAGLAETIDTDSPLAVAIWSEADSEAGYVIHRDGRMMPAGDYQHGFANIDQMKAALSSEDNEVANAARHEIGMIATCMQPYCGDMDENDLNYSIASSFAYGPERSSIVKLIKDGATLEQLLDAYSARTDNLGSERHGGESKQEPSGAVIGGNVADTRSPGQGPRP